MTSLHKLLPPVSAGTLGSLRVPGMDVLVIAAIDAAKALEASTVTPIQLARELDLDPHAAPNAAIAPEPTI